MLYLATMKACLKNKTKPFFQYTQEVSQITKPLAECVGLQHFSFKRTFKDKGKIYLFNHPSFYEHWFDNEYYQVSNKEEDISQYQDSVELWVSLPDPHRLYEMARQVFDIGNGLIITRKNENYCDFFFFATDAKNTGMNNFYLTHLDILQKFVDYFYEDTQSIIQRITPERLLLPSLGNVSEYGGTDDFRSDVASLLPFIESNTTRTFGYDKLTSREIEYLPFLTKGYSNKFIAAQLKLSERTVDDYIANIKYKFNCRTKQELIAKLAKIANIHLSN